MSTDSNTYPSDVQLLHTYLGQQLQGEKSDISLDTALSGFQEYYRQLNSLRRKVQEAADSLDQGKGRPLDVEALIGRVRQRLAEQGVT